MKNAATNETAKIEIYNICNGARAVGTGWMVVRYVDGCRANVLKRFEKDERAARQFAASWNTRTPAGIKICDSTVEIDEGCAVGEANSYCWSIGYGIVWSQPQRIRDGAAHSFPLEKYDPKRHGR